MDATAALQSLHSASPRVGSGRVAAAGAEAAYRRREPTATALYPIVQNHLESFLARAGGDPYDRAAPGWVEDDFRAYLRCGILAHGFARVRCTDCGAERLVAFSCKGRGVCPSCNTRRMVEVAAHLSDRVLPPLPLRQWVFSLPKRLRPFLPRDASLAGAVLGILLRAIRTLLLKRSPGAPARAQLGAVSFLHRFGSALNPHFHLHVVILDGLFSDDANGALQFHPAGDLGSQDIQRLQQTLRRRTLRLFCAAGCSTSTPSRTCSPGRRPAASASMPRSASPAATGPRDPRTADIRHVLYQPARPTPDGRALLVLSPLDFLAALARLIPPPRVHRHRYHGVLAPNAALRERVTALITASQPDAAPRRSEVDDSPATPAGSAARSRWARLLARIYEISPLICPDCGATMRILAFLTDPFTVSGILRHLGLAASPPPLTPARSPPPDAPAYDADPLLDLDQTPPFDPTEPDPIPEFDLDQTLGASERSSARRRRS